MKSHTNSVLYRGQVYKMLSSAKSSPSGAALYTLEVQHPKAKSREYHPKFYELIRRRPDRSDDSLGSMEMSWNCSSEHECETLATKIKRMSLPGVVVDYYPAI